MATATEYTADNLHLMRLWERSQRRTNGGRATADFIESCKGVHPFDVARALGAVRLSGPAVCSLMRQHKLTIRDLKARSGITLKRIREVRESGISGAYDGSGYPAAASIRDWVEMITGTDPGAHLDHPAIELLERVG